MGIYCQYPNPVVGGGDPKPYAGANAAWLMDEASGPIVDIINGISVTNDGTGPYNQACGIWTPGISFDGASGFHVNVSHSELALGAAQSLNLFVVVKYVSGNGVLIQTTSSGTGNPGYDLRMSSSSLTCEIVCTDTTYSNAAQWSRAENAALDACYDGNAHSLEIILNRTLNTANLKCDGVLVTIQDIDISAINGKAIGATGIGVGCDYRGTFAGLLTGTIGFIRQTNAASYP